MPQIKNTFDFQDPNTKYDIAPGGLTLIICPYNNLDPNGFFTGHLSRHWCHLLCPQLSAHHGRTFLVVLDRSRPTRKTTDETTVFFSFPKDPCGVYLPT